MQFVRQFQTAYADAVSCKIANVFSDKSLQNEGYVHKGFCQAGVPLVILLGLRLWHMVRVGVMVRVNTHWKLLSGRAYDPDHNQ